MVLRMTEQRRSNPQSIPNFTNLVSEISRILMEHVFGSIENLNRIIQSNVSQPRKSLIRPFCQYGAP